MSVADFLFNSATKSQVSRSNTRQVGIWLNGILAQTFIKTVSVRQGGKKGGPPAKFKAKFFDDSCLPDCDGLGFSMLVASDAACPTNMTLEQLEKEGVAKKDFCKPEVCKHFSSHIVLQTFHSKQLIPNLKLLSILSNSATY